MATFSMPAMLDIDATAAAGTPGCKVNESMSKTTWDLLLLL
jgi:hypothetical protein